MTVKEPSGKSTKTNLELKKYLNSSWVYVAFYLIITLVIFNQFFLGSGMLFSSDQMGGFDARVFLKNSLTKYHQLPLWFNSRLSGMPSIDAIFGDVLYLPSILIHLLCPVDRAISIKMIFHVFLAGVFFFLLLRKGFGFSALISFTGGLFYMMNPQFFTHIYPGHDGKMFVIAWLPFIIWRIKLLMEKPNLLNASLFGAGIGMSILTSHIQMTYFVLWGVFFYWALEFFVYAFLKKNIKHALVLGGYFWLSIGVGLLIGCAQILPSFLYVREAYSVRGVERGFEFAASWALGWAEAFSVWVPEFVNTLNFYWGENPFKLNSEYAGAVPLVMAVLAIVYKPRKWRIFWGAMALFTLLFAMGAHTPVFHIAYYLIPGVKKFRAASMIMFWFSFSTILLTALFLKDLVNGSVASLKQEKKKRWVKGLVITNVVLLLFTLIFSNKGFVQGTFAANLLGNEKQNIFEMNFAKNFVPCLWLWFLIVSVVLWLIIGVLSEKLRANIAVISILFIGFLDMYRVDFFTFQGGDPAHYKAPEYAFVKLVDTRGYFYEEPSIKNLQQEMKTAPFRCFTIPGVFPQNNPEGTFGLEGVGGFHDNELRWYREFRGEQDRNYFTGIIGYDQSGRPFLNADKIGYGNAFLDIANAKYILVRSDNKLLAIENKNALGRISFASSYIVLDSTKIIDALQQGTYDYRTTVALTKEPSSEVKSGQGNLTNDSLQTVWEKYSPNYRKVRVKVPGDGFLRISEVFYPKWLIKVDGKKVDFYQSDLAYMAIAVSAGEHTLEMIPQSIILGKVQWISVGTIVLLLFYWSLVLFVNKKRIIKIQG